MFTLEVFLMANKNYGNKLRELRLKAGYTQQVVADKLGLKNKSTLGSWEIGKSEPDADTFLKLCDIYEVKSFSYFRDNDHKQKTPPATQEEEKTDQQQRLLSIADRLSDEGFKKLLDQAELLELRHKK